MHAQRYSKVLQHSARDDERRKAAKTLMEKKV
jgi:hypothetical protein